MARESFESAVERVIAQERMSRRRFVGRAGSSALAMSALGAPPVVEHALATRASTASVLAILRPCMFLLHRAVVRITPELPHGA